MQMETTLCNVFKYKVLNAMGTYADVDADNIRTTIMSGNVGDISFRTILGGHN